jgi:hypothetical protein
MNGPFMNANLFELNNENVRITYSSQGNAGQPFLTYQDPEMDKTFQGAEIRSITGEIGELVTVTLFQGIDQGTRMLTLLLPTVTVAQAKAPIAIKTKAIVTTFPKVVGTNVPGPVETYRVESLHGTAQFEFVQTAIADSRKAPAA